MHGPEQRNKALPAKPNWGEAKKIARFIDRRALQELRQHIEEERPTVVAAGGFSTGKSFFNALFKEEILPVAGGPTTFVFTKIRHGEGKRRELSFTLSFR